MQRAPVKVSLAQPQAKYRYFAQRREAAKLAILNKLDPPEFGLNIFEVLNLFRFPSPDSDFSRQRVNHDQLGFPRHTLTTAL
jgi:hypothetical protein